MGDINNMAAGPDRRLKENGQAVNLANMIEALRKAIVVVGTACSKLTGRKVKSDPLC